MKIKLISFNIGFFILSMLSVYISIILDNGVSVNNVMLRNVRVETQRMQQSIAILENTEYQELIKNLDSNLNGLKINIAEYMTVNHAQAGVSDPSYQLDSRKVRLLPQDPFPIRIIRLDLKFKVDNAQALAGFLQSTNDVVSPWPTEVRACDIHRLPVSKLLVHCILDIHYWGLHD
ncbi:MAG: hypothetical protein ACJAZF_000012 [Granulosicoccus sp.]|jgi:hypothetical protein